MLVNPKEYLVRARREGWALGGFNVFNLESARAVIDAGEQTAAPLLVQTSEGAVKHVGLANIVAIVRQLAGQTKAPVALHLDHGKSEALARAAVDAGYTSVMIDASRESYEENVRETRDIVAYAHARGVHVEAELGTLGGIEDVGEPAAQSMLTKPDQAVRFAAETGVDALAVAIGTSHGAYKFKGEPHLDLDRLQAIAARIEQPIVLHGASSLPQEQVLLAERYGARLPQAQGIPPELIQKAVRLGIAKVNTDSDLRLVALGRLRQVLGERPDIFNLYELMGELEQAIRLATAERIRLLASDGKA
ncbi:MAG TPA: class II fructose-bisphosphate aldolase [Candidatus Dormibacteraeota bacterium]|nr:class II fructose-bisphosphate aldolase [Candidatus Dormibacteraeota bacterium]